MRIQRLNMDSSWWFEVGGQRLIVDPWLSGVEVDYFRWFNTQWHRTAPVSWADLPPFDGVLVTQKYADHFHPETLLRLEPATIFAPRSLAKQIRQVLPEANPYLFGPETPRHVWGGLTLHWLPSRRRMDPIYDAFLLDDGVESLLIAPHGIALDADHLAILQTAGPCAALLSPFNGYTLPSLLGGVVAPGLPGLERLVRHVEPQVIIPTHDEDKHARGLISRLARIDRFHDSQLSAHPWLASRYRPLSDYQAVQL